METAEPGRLKSLWTKYRKAIDDISAGMVQQASVAAIGIIIGILVARGLGPEKQGVLTLALSVALIVQALTDLGISQTAIRYGAREIAKGKTDEAHSVFRWAIRIRFLFVIAVVVSVYLLAPVIGIKLWKNPDLVPLIRLSLFLAPIAAIVTISQVYFQAHKRFRTNAVVVVGRQAIELVGIVSLALLIVWSVKWVLLIKIICGAIGALAFIAVIPKAALFSRNDYTGLSDRGGFFLLFKHPAPSTVEQTEIKATTPGRFATYMALSSLFVLAITRLDAWFLGAYCPDAEVGYYSVGLRYALPLVIFSNALNAALWPRVAGLTTPSELLPLLRKSFTISSLAATGGLVYAYFVPLTAPYLFGVPYTPSIEPARILCVAYSVAILICPIGVIGYGFELVRFMTLLNFLQMTISFTLYILLVPRYGGKGAALSLLAVNSVGAILAGGYVMIIARRLKKGLVETG